MQGHKSLRRIFLFSAFVLVITAGVLMSGSKTQAMDTFAAEHSENIVLIKGELETIPVDSLTRLSITDPNIADIVNATDEEILLIGRNAGQTVLFVWDEHGKRAIMITVSGGDLQASLKRLEHLLHSADIYELMFKINEKEGKIVISGDVPEHKQSHYESVVAKFSNDIIDLTRKEKIEDLVEIDLQITELLETLTKGLGIDWIASGSGGVSTDGVGFGGLFNPVYLEDPPSSDGKPKDWFKIGDFSRTSQLLFQVNALLREGKARILSQPKLVVKSGEEASFLVGGEIPIRTTTTSEGSTQENVEYKEYGIGMTITPTITKGLIDVLLDAEISDIDSSNPAGDEIAFLTRNTQTQLMLEDGQTIVLAGLIRQATSESVNKIPFLGSVPILGMFFRSRGTPTPNQDQELVISMTPTILSQKKKASANNAATNMQQPKNSYTTQVNYAPSNNNAMPYYSGISREMKSYVQAIQQKISQSIVYPREAQEYGWEGTVKLGMLILRDGTLAYSAIRETSGHQVFDENALNIARTVAPYADFPAESELQELNVTVPIIYSLSR